MRRRRAERCLLRAEEALAAGLESEAREALDEARSLRPSDTPELEQLRARVAARTVPVEAPAPPVQARRPLWPVAAAMFVLAATLLGLGLFGQRNAPASEVAATPTPAREARGPAVPPGENSPAAPATAIEHETVRLPPGPAPAAAGPVVATRADGPSGVGPMPVSMKSEPPVVATTGRETLPPVRASTPLLAVSPPSTVPQPEPAEIPRAGSGVALESLPSTLPPSAPAPAAVPAAEAPAAPAPEPDAALPRIRAVLSTYEAAFRSLDASAARAVWPTVDERALSRAFDGLASQSISLGGCSISVQGDAATARCTGSATWAPKVGGGERTAARRWDFALERSGNSWQIVRANVR